MRAKQHNFPLRFRSKKQMAQAKVIAKLKGWSLNEYMLRCLESQPEMKPVDETMRYGQFDRRRTEQPNAAAD